MLDSLTLPSGDAEAGDIEATPCCRMYTCASSTCLRMCVMDSQWRCFLLETHSEHLILRLLRRIEETNSGDREEGAPPLAAGLVSVVFLEQVDGELRATPLRIDDTGEFIDRWPHGFFEERADELI